MTENVRAEADILRRSGRLAEAEALLAAAPVAPDTLGMLAEIQYERHDFAGCDRTLTQLISLSPRGANISTHRLLAKIRFTTGGAQAASAVMRKALDVHPGETEFVAAYAETLPLEEAVAELTRHLDDLNDDPGRRAYVLMRITTLRAPHVRARQGLPHYGTSWPDTYRWPDAPTLEPLGKALEEEIAMGSPRATARLALAFIAMAQGDFETAEAYHAEVRGQGKRTPAEFSAFGKGFQDELAAMTEADLFCGLVPVQRLTEFTPRSGPTIYMASDERYFNEFTVTFLRQVDAAGIPLDVHVHLLDGTEADWAGARAFLESLKSVRTTLTAEASGARAHGNMYARVYYHAVRFVRFYAELKRTQRPMWILDCDLTLQGDPRPLFASLETYDLALRTTPSFIDPMLKMSAACVGVSPTAAGLEFARRVAASVIYWKDRGTWAWGIDQIGMLSAYAYMSAAGREPKTLFLDAGVGTGYPGDTSAIRIVGGIKKFTEL